MTKSEIIDIFIQEMTNRFNYKDQWVLLSHDDLYTIKDKIVTENGESVTK